MLITADIHLSSNPRDEYRWHFLERLLPHLMAEHKQTRLAILGDLAEEKDYHKGELVNRMVEGLVALDCEIILLKGNHDFLGDPDLPYWKFLRLIPGLTWVNEPTEINGNLFLPYTPNWERDWAVETGPDGYDFIFAHQTFTGAVTEHGHKLEGVPHSALPKADTVVSGDVHVPQSVGNVIYVGAPYTIDFGDSYKPRVLLLERGKLKSIPCTGPQKRLVEAKDGIILGDVELNKGDILKVRALLTPDQQAKWPEIQSYIRKWGEKNGLIIYAVQPVVEQAGRIKVVHKAAPARSDKQLLADYGKARQVPERTMKTGQFLMDKTK